MQSAGISRSSFRRRSDPSSPGGPSSAAITAPGLKRGPNGSLFVSSGIPTLDAILGGGFLVGSLVVIVEDTEAPHHLLLLRNFMAQGLIHAQPLLFASAALDPREFLRTLPAPVKSRSSSSGSVAITEEHLQSQKDLRIAWQYRKYFGGEDSLQSKNGDPKDYSCEFHLRKALDKHLIIGEHVTTTKVQDHPNLESLFAHCSTFLSQQQKNGSKIPGACRVVIQSLCAPQCRFSDLHWEMVSFIRSLKSALRASNGVALLTFPSSVLPPSFSVRWKHLADTLLSVSAVPDDDKDLAQLLSGYQEMVGFLHVHKVAQIGSQVPANLQARTYSLKVPHKKSLVLEPLNQAPVDGSDRGVDKAQESCVGSSKKSPIDF